MSSQRVNSFPSPNFKNIDFFGGAAHSVDDDGWLTVTTVNNEGSSAVHVNLAPSTQYAWSVEVKAPDSTVHTVSYVYTANWKLLSAINTANGRGECHFTTPDDEGKINISFQGGLTNGSPLKFMNPLLELASTYDAAVAGGARRTPSCSLGTLAQNNRRSAWVVAA